MPVFQIHVTILSWGQEEGPISNSSSIVAFDTEAQAERAIVLLGGQYSLRRDCTAVITRLYDPK